MRSSTRTLRRKANLTTTTPGFKKRSVLSDIKMQLGVSVLDIKYV